MKKFSLFSGFISVIFLISNPFILSQNMGPGAAIEVNQIYLPFSNTGNIAEVNVYPGGSGGQISGKLFLFSSGFWLSGYADSLLWANAVTASSLLQDYQAGTVGMNPYDPKAAIYKLNKNDEPFGQSWQDWIDAVNLGADFYDGDGDGIYNPVDKNSNGVWDPDEDKPDILLDETYWCVFNDGVPASQRIWLSEPMGIEVRQTIFAAASQGATDNTIFIRYKIKNTGSVRDTLRNIYLGICGDPDIGDGTDDLGGCDTLRNATYSCNDQDDVVFGDTPPTFLTRIFQGPIVYIPGETFLDNNGNNIYDEGIDTPLDTAYNMRGPLGIRYFPGAKNLNMTSSIHYIMGDVLIRDPVNVLEARYFQSGLLSSGGIFDPCNYHNYGQVLGGIDCSEVDPLFWYSGNRIQNTGWINIGAHDIRQLQSTGLFDLIKDQEVDIIIAYVVGMGNSVNDGITLAKNYSDEIQQIYDDNFAYTLVNVKDEPKIISSCVLFQNYPNPFNPTTTIKYSINSRQFVSLKVYDVLGNAVATLVNEEKSAGNYSFEFNGSNLASGIYFYQLKTDGYTATKKLILLK